MFYCKFNDPVYVKLEKIDVLVKVANEANVEALLGELKEYANDVDFEIIKKSVRAIGQIILKIDKASKKAADILHDIVNSPGNYGLQEAVVVAKDIFRKFPTKFEHMISDFANKFEEFFEVESKASIIWIIGEYAEKIAKADKILNTYIDNFLEEPVKVQLSLLTATVKLYLKKPDSADAVIKRVLKIATEEGSNPDLMDRAYIYWRMLSNSPQKTKYVVLGEKPNIADDSYNLYSDEFVDSLISQISSLCSVYHKTPEELQLSIKKQ